MGDTFAADISKWAEKSGRNLDQVTRGVTLRLFSAVVRDTRVDTGRLRGNWQVSLDSPASGELERFQKNGGLVAAEAGQVSGMALNIMTNNLPYAEVWEERDAMIGRAVADFKRIVEQEAAKLR